MNLSTVHSLRKTSLVNSSKYSLRVHWIASCGCVVHHEVKPEMSDKTAAQVAIDLEQQDSGEQEHRQELYLFNKIATITYHTLDLQEINNEALATVLEFLQIEAGLLLLWDRLRQHLTYAASRGFPPEYVQEISSGKSPGDPDHRKNRKAPKYEIDRRENSS
jgi:hypothetical protein